MQWLFEPNPEITNISVIWIFRIANLISAIVLLLMPAVLGYFWKSKRRSVSDSNILLCIGIVFMLGLKKFLMAFMTEWAPYPIICTLLDIGTAVLLIIQLCLLPSLILTILRIPSLDELQLALKNADGELLFFQDENVYLKLENAALLESNGKLIRELETMDWGNRKDCTTAELREVLDKIGGSSGDGDS